MVNQLLFPGDPYLAIPPKRMKGGKMRPMTPKEYSFFMDDVRRYMSQYEGSFTLTSIWGTPPWILNQQYNDFLREVTQVSANPDEGISIQQLSETGDPAALQGGFGATLPTFDIKWITEPTKTATKTVENIRKSMGVDKNILVSKEMSDRAEMDGWIKVLGSNSTGTTPPRNRLEAAAQAVYSKATAIEAKSLEAVPTSKALDLVGKGELLKHGVPSSVLADSPLRLSGMGVYRDEWGGAGVKYAILTAIDKDPLTGAPLVDPITGGPKKSVTKGTIGAKADVYQDVADSFIELKRYSDNAGTRDLKLTGYYQNVANAVSTEFNKQLSDAGGDWKVFFATNFNLDDTTDPGEITRKQIKRTIEGYQSRSRLAEYLAKTDNKFDGGTAVSNSLEKIILDGAGEFDAAKNAYTNIDRFNSSLEKYSRTLLEAEDQIAEVEKSLKIFDAATGTYLDTTESRKFAAWIQPYKDHVQEMKAKVGETVWRVDASGNAVIDRYGRKEAVFTRSHEMTDLVDSMNADFASGGRAVKSRAQAANLRGWIDSKRKGGVNGRAVGVGDTFRSGYQRGLLMDLGEKELLFGKKGDLNSIGGVLKMMDPNSDGAIRLKRVQVLTVDISQERVWAMADELLYNMEKGTMGNYLWKRMRPRMEGFTPAWWANRQLRKMHYFGLAMDTGTDKVTAYKWADRLFGQYKDASGATKEGLLSGLTLHKFDLNLDLSASGGPRSFKMKVEGGEHFTAAGAVYSMYKSKVGDLSEDALKQLLVYDTFKRADGTLAGFASLKDALADDEFLHLFMAKNAAGDALAFAQSFGSFTRANGTVVTFSSLAEAMKDAEFRANFLSRDGVRAWGFANPEWEEKFYKDFDKFKTWIKSQPAFASFANDDSALMELVKKLGIYNASYDTYKIANRYLGLWQKLIVKLNILQTTVLGKLKYILGPVQAVKVAASEFLSNALYAAIVGGTAGAGAVFYPLKVVIQMVVNKVLDFGELTLKAIFKGDFAALDKALDKFMSQAFKVLIAALAIPCGCFAIITMLIVLVVTVFMSAIAPSNPARSISYDQYDFYIIGPGDATGAHGDHSDAVGSCPLLATYSVSTPSLTGSDNANAVGHGSQSYWDSYCHCPCTDPTSAGCTQCRAGSCYCNFNVPGNWVTGGGFNGPLNSNLACSSKAGGTKSDLYGFAADVIYTVNYPAPNPINVYAPNLAGITTWRLVYVYDTSLGKGVKLVGDGTDGHTYDLLLLHLLEVDSSLAAWRTGTVTVAPGDYIGPLWDGWGGSGNRNRHVHMELSDGTPLRPDLHLCL